MVDLSELKEDDYFTLLTRLKRRNLKYMRRFAEEYPDNEIVQEVLAQLTWYHNITLLEKIKLLQSMHSKI